MSDVGYTAGGHNGDQAQAISVSQQLWHLWRSAQGELCSCEM